MKVLFWTDGFWPRIGGIETQGFEFVRGMQKKGHQYIVLAQKDDPSWQDEETYREIAIKRIDFNAIIERKELRWIRATQEYLEWVLKEFLPDVIHLNAGIGGSAFAFLLFRNMFRMPIVFTCHAPYLLEGQFPPLVAKIASGADRICCVSNWVLTEMKKYLPQLHSKLRCIYNGLPLPKKIAGPLSFTPPILLAFGRLAPEKGFDTAIRAFALLKKRGSSARLVIAGGGPERSKLQQLANQLDLRDSVEFTGVLTEEEVLIRFQKATLVIVPSLIESFGLVILEAMQNQRPVIASNIEGVPEVVADQETGILVAARDPAAFCHAIEDLLGNPDRAIKMGMAGQERSKRFTIDQNVVEYENLYRELLS